MHPTAMSNCKRFFDTYSGAWDATESLTVVEIGSQDVNGSLRDTCPSHHRYVGVDFQMAKGVDVVLTDPYSLPFESASVDVVLSSSCFEHSEFFWLVFLEIMRVLKPKGLFYLNAPSTGSFHRFPVDCWRFYPDSGAALVKWAKRSGYDPAALESYTQLGGTWQDYVAVFLKDQAHAGQFPQRIIHSKTDFENGQLFMNDSIQRASFATQSDKKLSFISQIVSEAIQVV